MTPERWRRVESLVEEARERPAAERSGFLAEACGADGEMRREVEALLASYDESSRFLESPAAVRFPRRPGSDGGSAIAVGESLREAPSSGRPPRRLGPYRILKTLGEGGMGTVYLAEQTEPIRRRVALKVIRPGMMQREAVRRFEVERQALARMNHPHIAQAYEAGETGGGQPYFVMEHVAGLPITRYCDEKRLSVRQRLELFEAVCDGVQHLHQKGILHRDVKPSNVLVAEDRDRPVPKIIDFGIAKALDQPLTDGTVFTGERLIGTPSYLSPEAIRTAAGGLDVDTRSDVYALGVLLYELLTGELPFGRRDGNESFLEVARRITEEEAPLASARLASLGAGDRAARAVARRTEPQALVRRLRGDLDWILARALEKDRARRYGSASELAEDLRRHLRHEPVTASPPSTLYRVRKYVRRHRAGVVAAALVVLALVVGIAARTMEAARANREAARANEEAARANREAEAARQVSDFLVGLFEVADPDRAGSGETTAREILDRGAEKLKAQELEEQPLLQARLMDTIGEVYLKLGLLEPATELLTTALGVRRSQLGERHPDVATSLNSLGKLHFSRGEYLRAAAVFRESLAIREQVLGPDHRDVAKSLNNVGAALMMGGELAAAAEVLERALEIKERNLGAEHLDVGMSLSNLANVYRTQGSYVEAERLERRGLAILEKALGPDHTDVAKTLNNLGLTLYEQGRYAEAESVQRRALSMLETLLGPDHPVVARSVENLAQVRGKLGLFAESEALYRRAVRYWEAAGMEEHPSLAITLGGLGNLYRDQGLFSDAERSYERALEIHRAVSSPDHPERVRTMKDYALLLRQTGHEAEAADLVAGAAPATVGAGGAP